MTSGEIIKQAKATFNNLVRKNFEWRSFYNGYLEGFISGRFGNSGKEQLIIELTKKQLSAENDATVYTEQGRDLSVLYSQGLADAYREVIKQLKEL